MSIASQGLILSKVKEPDTFCTVENLLEQGRAIINSVDPKIVGFLANFTSASTPAEHVDLSEKVIKRLDGAPKDVLTSLARHVDFSGISPEVKERNLQTLASLTSQRFTVVSLVAHSKKMNGEKSPFHATRHASVLESKAKEIAALRGNAKIGVTASSDFMAAGCFFQEAYLQDKGETAVPIRARLEKIGITPL